MPPIRTREELLKKVHTNRRRLEKNLSLLLPQDMLQPGVLNELSAKDILAHLYDWEEHFLGWYGASQRGESPQVPAPGITWKPADIDRFNRQIYEAHRSESLEEVMAAFRDVHQKFVALVEGMSDEELFTLGYYPWTGNATLARWISAYASHDAWGQKHIRRWAKENK